MEALGHLLSIWHWVIWCILGLRHQVSYQVITISPRLGLGKWCTPLLDLWAMRPSRGTNTWSWWQRGDQDKAYNNSPYLWRYTMSGHEWTTRTLQNSWDNFLWSQKYLKDHETLVVVHVTITIANHFIIIITWLLQQFVTEIFILIAAVVD